MQQPHPLTAVISSNPLLAKLYNEDTISGLYASKCMTEEDAQSMLNEGVEFENVIAINGEGEQFSSEFTANVKVGDDTEVAVKSVHEAIESMLFAKGTG